MLTFFFLNYVDKFEPFFNLQSSFKNKSFIPCRVCRRMRESIPLCQLKFFCFFEVIMKGRADNSYRLHVNIKYISKLILYIFNIPCTYFLNIKKPCRLGLKLRLWLAWCNKMKSKFEESSNERWQCCNLCRSIFFSRSYLKDWNVVKLSYPLSNFFDTWWIWWEVICRKI